MKKKQQKDESFKGVLIAGLVSFSIAFLVMWLLISQFKEEILQFLIR